MPTNKIFYKAHDLLELFFFNVIKIDIPDYVINVQ